MSTPLYQTTQSSQISVSSSSKARDFENRSIRYGVNVHASCLKMFVFPVVFCGSDRRDLSLILAGTDKHLHKVVSSTSSDRQHPEYMRPASQRERWFVQNRLEPGTVDAGSPTPSKH